MILLNKCEAPLTDVAILGSSPLRVYLVLFEAAQHDVRDNCGGTSSWTIKGIASELGVTRETVSRALNKLLDCGYIQIAGELSNREGSNSTVWRVTHQKMLDAVRYSIELIGLPSERLKKMRTKHRKVDATNYYETPMATDF